MYICVTNDKWHDKCIWVTHDMCMCVTNDIICTTHISILAPGSYNLWCSIGVWIIRYTTVTHTHWPTPTHTHPHSRTHWPALPTRRTYISVYIYMCDYISMRDAHIDPIARLLQFSENAHRSTHTHTHVHVDVFLCATILAPGSYTAWCSIEVWIIRYTTVTHTHWPTHTHTRPRPRTHTHTHAHIDAHPRTHTHTHAHIDPPYIWDDPTYRSTFICATTFLCATTFICATYISIVAPGSYNSWCSIGVWIIRHTTVPHTRLFWTMRTRTRCVRLEIFVDQKGTQFELLLYLYTTVPRTRLFSTMRTLCMSRNIRWWKGHPIWVVIIRYTTVPRTRLFSTMRTWTCCARLDIFVDPGHPIWVDNIRYITVMHTSETFLASFWSTNISRCAQRDFDQRIYLDVHGEFKYSLLQRVKCVLQWCTVL